MNLIKLCLDRPVGVCVGVILLVLFGLLSFFAIPVQLTPNVDTPLINVSTRWSGANPQEIEREIVDRQEEWLRSVKGLREMTSTSRDNSADIALEFAPGVDKSEALRDVSDKLRQVTGYPLEVDEPTVVASDPAISSPIAWLILYSREPGDGVRKLRDFAEDYIKPYLDRVDGVASTDIYGGYEREVKVSVDAGRLAARGLTLRQVQQALQRQNENISAGTREQGKRDYAVRTVGQYETIEDVAATVVAYTPGGPVYLRDVADVELGFKDAEGFVRSKGEFVLAFPVRREVGANVVAVMDDLQEAIRKVNDEVLKARGMDLELVQTYDETIYIRQAIEMVRSNIVYGSALVLGLLLAFLRSWRATAVLALSIPVSVVGTFLVIVLLGRTLNVISLAGIAFAVGDVVDSAYVVLENIFRHRQMGKGVRAAVLEGTREVWGAVLASTLTTMAVFIPVIFVQDEAGQLFRDISIAEVAAVGLSMIVAVTVIPPLAARLLGGKKESISFPREDAPQLANGEPPAAKPKHDVVLWFAGVMAALVDRVNRLPVLRIGLIVAMTFGSLGIASLLVPDSTYLPAGNRNLVFGFLLTPPGYGLAEFNRMADSIEEVVEPYWSTEQGSPRKAELDRQWIDRVQQQLDAGQIAAVKNPGLSRLQRDRAQREWLTPPPLIDNFFLVAWQGGCFMGCSSRDEAKVKPLVRLLETAGRKIPGIFPVFFQTQLFSFSGGNTAEIQIRGDDLEKVNAAALAMQMECMKRFGFPRANPSNFALGRPEVRIVPSREKAADLGLSVVDVGLIVEAAVDGAYVGDFRQTGGDTIDISLFIKGQQDRPTQELAQLPIYTLRGDVVSLQAAVTLVDTTAPEQINHTERQRSVTLEITPPEALALQTVIRQVKDEIEPMLRASGRIDPAVLITLTGNADKLVAARNALVGEWKGWTLQSLRNVIGGRFFLSVIIVYLLMCALYESWLYPFVIMFSVPLAVLGGFLGLSLTHWATLLSTHQPVQQLDVLTFLGFIMLVGLVVKNAILLVEQSLVYLREHGMHRRDAIREAVRVRVRPVCMTSLTSVFGLLPLAVMPGAGSELYRGLAAVILGGMVVSTIGTFVLVPCVLGLVLDIRARLAGERDAGSQPAKCATGFQPV